MRVRVLFILGFTGHDQASSMMLRERMESLLRESRQSYSNNQLKSVDRQYLSCVLHASSGFD